MSMAQIGEFAFIVATLGLSLGVISPFLFPIAVGASAITTFTTPYMIKYSEPFYNLIERILPARWIKKLNKYSAGAESIQAESDWKIVGADEVLELLRVSGIAFAVDVEFAVKFSLDVAHRF